MISDLTYFVLENGPNGLPAAGSAPKLPCADRRAGPSPGIPRPRHSAPPQTRTYPHLLPGAQRRAAAVRERGPHGAPPPVCALRSAVSP